MLEKGGVNIFLLARKALNSGNGKEKLEEQFNCSIETEKREIREKGLYTPITRSKKN